MTQAISRSAQQREVERQVAGMLGSSAAFNALSPGEREQIRRDTTAIVDTMVQNRLRQGTGAAADPFAVPLQGEVGGITIPGLPGQGGGGAAPAPTFTGGATQPGQQANFGPTNLGDFGSGIALGVAQTGQLLREVNFPAFVAELVQGVFQAVVDASIQQMKAYGELVQSVTMSLSDFRDQNVSPNQGRDHLVSKFPTLMQINVTDQGPRVAPKPGWDDQDLPDFRQSLGVDVDIGDLDEETIEEVLVPAARDDLARQRQNLLATMMLMGINRIVVTDGKINAKLKFDFRARDQTTTFAQAWDYENMGQTEVQQSSYEKSEDTGADYKESRWRHFGTSRSGESSRWSKGTDQYVSTPTIYMTEQSQTQTAAEIEAGGQLRGDVSLNFKSETVDLNQIATQSDVFRMQQVSSAGRGALPAGAPPPAATPPTGAESAPAPAAATP